MADLLDLLGKEFALTPAEKKSVCPKRKKTKRRGYAYAPGTGPAGETCGSCQHIYRKGGASKTYLKCQKARAKWTGGPGSDIYSRSPACKFWEAKKENDDVQER